MLEAPPEPHTKFVQLDARATATLMNFMLGQAFSCMRVGHLYGKWAEDGEGAAGVEVHAIYEPKQDNTDKEIRLVDDAEGEAKADAVAAMLGLVRVGVVIAHPAREYAFTINELLLASKLHAAAVEKEGEKGKRFVTVKARYERAISAQFWRNSAQFSDGLSFTTGPSSSTRPRSRAWRRWRRTK